jgi:hypothetical protein
MPKGVFAKPENAEKMPCAHRPMRLGSLVRPAVQGLFNTPLTLLNWVHIRACRRVWH